MSRDRGWFGCSTSFRNRIHALLPLEHPCEDAGRAAGNSAFSDGSYPPPSPQQRAIPLLEEAVKRKAWRPHRVRFRHSHGVTFQRALIFSQAACLIKE